jgi:hypothetical protein
MFVRRRPARGPSPFAPSALLRLAPLFALGLLSHSRADEPSFEPTDRYEVRTIEGWKVFVHKGFLSDRPELARRTLTHLGQQLYQVVRNVPAPAVAKLMRVKIWVEEREPHHPCMAYHPDAGWLRGHGMNPDKARCVEVANARNFLDWTHEQPWMVLHELAHAYHHQFLDGGYANATIAEAYRKAEAEKTYASVLHFDGKSVRAYALNNPQEYFAEATEAYFGANDFFPFVRAELRRHDPTGHDAVSRAWGAR